MSWKLECAELVPWARDYKGPKFHAVLSDPPYGLRFMGKSWDVISAKEWGAALLPHLFPGAVVFMFSGTRTWHKLATGMEEAGFEIWDTLMWLYGSGFPKAQDISKLIEKRNGDVRPSWSGHKTPALKPAWEPIIAFRAPSGGKTYAELALEYGTGSLNIAAERIGTAPGGWGGHPSQGYSGGLDSKEDPRPADGRFPANLLLDEVSAAALDQQTDGASRFFYVAKASSAERDAGLEGFAARQRDDSRNANQQSMNGGEGNPYNRGAMPKVNPHPTVKPIDLGYHLASLLLPPPSVSPRRLLVPFCGSGSEVIGALRAGWDEIVAVDKDPEYVRIAEARITGDCPLFNAHEVSA